MHPSAGAQLRHRWLRQRFGASAITASRPASSTRGNVTLYEGNHEIKVGGDYMDGRTRGDQLLDGRTARQAPERVRPALLRAPILRAQPGRPHARSRHSIEAPRSSTTASTCRTRGRCRPGLTVNVGLRWDGEQTNNYAGQTVLRFNNDWQPRIGVVWDPWRDGATKVFAFAGRFSYALPTVAAAASFGNFPGLHQTYNFDPVSVVQDPNVLRPRRAARQARRVEPGRCRRQGIVAGRADARQSRGC